MKKTAITKDQCKDTGLAIVLICLILFLIKKSGIAIIVAMAATVLTMTWPTLLRPLARFWFGLSHFMGEIVSKILLSIVFFLVAFPIGFLRKMSGKDAMRIKQWKQGKNSVFVDRNHCIQGADLEKPF